MGKKAPEVRQVVLLPGTGGQEGCTCSTLFWVERDTQNVTLTSSRQNRTMGGRKLKDLLPQGLEHKAEKEHLEKTNK